MEKGENQRGMEQIETAVENERERQIDRREREWSVGRRESMGK